MARHEPHLGRPPVAWRRALWDASDSAIMALSGDKEPAAEVNLVQVEQFLIALGPPARFQVGAQVAYHSLLNCRADRVPHRYCAPDLLVQVRLRPPPVGGEVAVAAVPRDGYRLQPSADSAGPLGQRVGRPALSCACSGM